MTKLNPDQVMLAGAILVDRAMGGYRPSKMLG